MALVNHGFGLNEEITIFNGWLTQETSDRVHYKIEVIQATRIVRLGTFQADQVVELCSGLGGMSAAASALHLCSMAAWITHRWPLLLAGGIMKGLPSRVTYATLRIWQVSLF